MSVVSAVAAGGAGPAGPDGPDGRDGLDLAALRRLGVALAKAGVTERAVRACFGVAALAHLPRALPHRPDPGPRPPRAALPLWLLCAGRAVAADAARAALGDALDALVAAGLVAHDGAQVIARCALAPIGPSIAVVDRLDRGGAMSDAPDPADRVPWPDDSTHHLIACLPPRRVARWLDVGTGAALAPLAAPGRAAAIRATDVSPRAIACARLGCALSGVAAELALDDLAAGAGGGWELITFNAPIPTGGDALLARFWADVPARAARAAAGAAPTEVLVHSVVAAEPLAALAHLPGAAAVLRYAPGFAITCWRPGAPAGRALVDVALTAAAPHVTRAALDAALATATGEAPPAATGDAAIPPA